MRHLQCMQDMFDENHYDFISNREFVGEIVFQRGGWWLWLFGITNRSKQPSLDDAIEAAESLWE